MKWIILTGVVLMVTGCGCCQSTELVTYGAVAPVVAYKPVVTYKPVVAYRPVVVAPVVAPVVEPVLVSPGYIEPLDVTTTTIDFY